MALRTRRQRLQLDATHRLAKVAHLRMMPHLPPLVHPRHERPARSDAALTVGKARDCVALKLLNKPKSVARMSLRRDSDSVYIVPEARLERRRQCDCSSREEVYRGVLAKRLAVVSVDAILTQNQRLAAHSLVVQEQGRRAN